MSELALRYVQSFRDRHGHPRHYFRRRGFGAPLPGAPGDDAFMTEYLRLLSDPEGAWSRARKPAFKRAPKPPRLLTEELIASLAVPWARKNCGIYFLLREGRVIYVGRSRNVYFRVLKHKHRQFQAWHWLPCAESDLERLERAYLDLLLPALNRDDRTKRQRLNPYRVSNRSLKDCQTS